MNCWLGERGGRIALERMVRQSPVCTYCLAKSLAEQYSRQQMKQAKLRSDLLQDRERKMLIVWVSFRRATQKTSKMSLKSRRHIIITDHICGSWPQCLCHPQAVPSKDGGAHLNPFTAILAATSLEKRPTEVANLKSLWLFPLFA